MWGKWWKVPIAQNFINTPLTLIRRHSSHQLFTILRILTLRSLCFQGRWQALLTPLQDAGFILRYKNCAAVIFEQIAVCALPERGIGRAGLHKLFEQIDYPVPVIGRGPADRQHWLFLSETLDQSTTAGFGVNTTAGLVRAE